MTTRVFNLRLSDEEMSALKAQAAAEGLSMHQVAVSAINARTHRRSHISGLLDEIDVEHAITLKGLADR
jgi:ABC-type uncharacterized transport system substrate-binding protein